MKNPTKLTNLIYGALLLASGVFATLTLPTPAWSQYYTSRSQIADFEAFMREHPKASTELQQNPDLVYNKKWLDKHPEVDHFLKGRPELRDTIAHRPGRVFGSNDRFDWRYDRRDYDRFDRDHRWNWQHR
jgi:hypothetical protein